MTEYICTTQERLTLWAGQLFYPTRQTRAVAIACAAFAKPLDWQGKTGRLTLDPPLLMAVARELVDVPDLDPPMTAAILRWLLLAGYLQRQPSAGEMPGLAGLPVFVDTSVLPVRVTDADVVPLVTGVYEQNASGTRCSGAGRAERAKPIGGDLSREPQGESATNAQEAA